MGNIGVGELGTVLLVVALVVTGVLLGLSRRLVACRACGRLISPRARACPRCGDPRGA